MTWLFVPQQQETWFTDSHYKQWSPTQWNLSFKTLHLYIYMGELQRDAHTRNCVWHLGGLYTKR